MVWSWINLYGCRTWIGYKHGRYTYMIECLQCYWYEEVRGHTIQKEQKDLPVDCCAFSVVRRLDVSSPPPLTIHFWEFLVLRGAPDFESYLEHWVLVHHRSPSLVLGQGKICQWLSLPCVRWQPNLQKSDTPCTEELPLSSLA